MNQAPEFVAGQAIAADVAAVSRIDLVRSILDVVCRTTGMGFSAVARVTDRQWIACAVDDRIGFGLKPGGELELATTICHEIRQSGQGVVIDHVAEDAAFCQHHTPRMYGFQSYISLPITLPDGRFFGTLCAIDPRPARLNTPETLGMFKLFAELIGQHLHAQERVAVSEAALLDARETSRLRDQFIAVLGHDLRNPLGAISSSAEVLRSLAHDPEAGEFLDIIDRSTGRMGELISNVLDFARGKLGAGMGVTRVVDPMLEPTFEHVVAELRTAWPGRVVESEFVMAEEVACDASRVGQMLSNLLANALAHGDVEGSVRAAGRAAGGVFELSVTNRGKTIPPEVMAQLFQPFSRGSVRPGQQGLGLGLYISAEIARAHQGTLAVVSEDGETRFTFRMPTAN